MPFKAIIFDMDGTLVDNLSHWAEADEKFLRTYAIERTPEYVTLINGSSLLESVRHIKERYQLAPSVEELLAEKIATTNYIYEVAGPTVGAESLLERVRAEQHKVAIASGSPTSRVQQIVDRFGWHQYFDALVSADHVGSVGKPDPAIFLYAAKRLGVDPAECLVIEDARNGLLAAKAAGMSCAVVHSDPQEDFSRADLVINTLEHRDLYSLIGL